MPLPAHCLSFSSSTSTSLSNGNMENNDEQARSLVRHRITSLQIQERFVTGLTPLLLREIRQAIEIHSEAAEQPDLTTNTELLRDLDNAHDRVSEHWCKFHENYMTSSSLLAYIGLHQQFLTHFLVDEYTSTPALRDTKSTNVHDWACDMAGLIQTHSTAENDSTASDLEYQRSIVSPLEEMGLNKAHVEDKIRALVAVQRGQSCGYVRRLIRQCDWQKLAEVLLNDRELAIDLFEPRPVVEGTFNDETRSIVVKSIDNTIDKYFTELWSPTKYTLSKHAIAASAKHSSAKSSDHPITLGEGKDEVIRGIHDIAADAFTGLGTGFNLGLGSHTASLRLSRDDKAPLMGSKDRE